MAGTLGTGTLGSGTLGEPTEVEVATSTTRARIRELPRTDLHVEAETPDGRYFRWGIDERRPENVPSGLGCSSTAPGGFDSISGVLPRKPGISYPDLARLSTLRLRGPGGELCSEARLKEAPRTSGDQMSVTPATEGWLAHLQDDNTAVEIYRDVDLSGWQGMSRARQAALGTGWAIFEPAVTVDAGGSLPALELLLTSPWSLTQNVCEAHYDAGAVCRVAGIYYDIQLVGFLSSDTSLSLTIFGSTSDSEAGEAISSNLRAATTGTQTFSTPKRVGTWQLSYTSAHTGDSGINFPIFIRRLAVYGNHGLTLRGTEPEAGFYASDMIANAVGRWAPLLNFTTGSTGTLRPTANVIAHLTFKEPTTALAMLQAANAFENNLYAVWENRTFCYYDWGDMGRKWRARIAPSELAETGPSTERLRNGIIVTYRDVDGSTKSAGPIGSGCNTESSELEDKDPENPANQRGIRMWGQAIDLGIVTVQAEAIRVGTLILARLKETDSSGQAKLVGFCEDDKGITRPAWQVRAGDTITFVDAADTSERRIIRADYDDNSKTNSITLDAPPDGVPDLLAQLGVSVADLGL